jgi:hypothetical protein
VDATRQDSSFVADDEETTTRPVEDDADDPDVHASVGDMRGYAGIDPHDLMDALSSEQPDGVSSWSQAMATRSKEDTISPLASASSLTGVPFPLALSDLIALTSESRAAESRTWPVHIAVLGVGARLLPAAYGPRYAEGVQQDERRVISVVKALQAAGCVGVSVIQGGYAEVHRLIRSEAVPMPSDLVQGWTKPGAGEARFNLQDFVGKYSTALVDHIPYSCPPCRHVAISNLQAKARRDELHAQAAARASVNSKKDLDISNLRDAFAKVTGAVSEKIKTAAIAATSAPPAGSDATVEGVGASANLMSFSDGAAPSTGRSMLILAKAQGTSLVTALKTSAVAVSSAAARVSRGSAESAGTFAEVDNAGSVAPLGQAATATDVPYIGSEPLPNAASSAATATAPSNSKAKATAVVAKAKSLVASALAVPETANNAAASGAPSTSATKAEVKAKVLTAGKKLAKSFSTAQAELGSAIKSSGVAQKGKEEAKKVFSGLKSKFASLTHSSQTSNAAAVAANGAAVVPGQPSASLPHLPEELLQELRSLSKGDSFDVEDWLQFIDLHAVEKEKTVVVEEEMPAPAPVPAAEDILDEIDSVLSVAAVPGAEKATTMKVSKSVVTLVPRYVVLTRERLLILKAEPSAVGIGIVKTNRPLTECAKLSFSKNSPTRITLWLHTVSADRAEQPGAAAPAMKANIFRFTSEEKARNFLKTLQAAVINVRASAAAPA